MRLKMIKILAAAADEVSGYDSNSGSSDHEDGAMIGIRDYESDDSELGYSMDDFCVPEAKENPEDISDGSVVTAEDLSDSAP
jgi:hypothetical protein